jgi:hypothetical protein
MSQGSSEYYTQIIRHHTLRISFTTMDKIQISKYNEFVSYLNLTMEAHTQLLKTTRNLYQDLQTQNMLEDNAQMLELVKNTLISLTISSSYLIKASEIEDKIS